MRSVKYNQGIFEKGRENLLKNTKIFIPAIILLLGQKVWNEINKYTKKNTLFGLFIPTLSLEQVLEWRSRKR